MINAYIICANLGGGTTKYINELTNYLEEKKIIVNIISNKYLFDKNYSPKK